MATDTEKQLDVEKVKKAFSYDPETGVITRAISYGNAWKGQTFSGTNSVSVFNIHIRLSRLAWLLHHGSWPPDGYWIDHINGAKGDNRIVNLRLATPTQNQQNKASYGTYAKGVVCRFDGSRKKPFQARIRVDGKRILLGSFATEAEAAEAYRQAALKYHGEFACLE